MHGWSLDFWSNGVGQECRNGSCVSVCMYAMVIVMVNLAGWLCLLCLFLPLWFFQKECPFRLPKRQDTGSIFLRKISTFGGSPPFLTLWILAFRGMLPHTEEIPHQWGYPYANSHCKSQNRLHYISKIRSYAGLSCSPCIPTAPHRKQILSHWVADFKGEI